MKKTEEEEFSELEKLCDELLDDDTLERYEKEEKENEENGRK